MRPPSKIVILSESSYDQKPIHTLKNSGSVNANCLFLAWWSTLQEANIFPGNLMRKSNYIRILFQWSLEVILLRWSYQLAKVYERKTVRFYKWRCACISSSLYIHLCIYISIPANKNFSDVKMTTINSPMQWGPSFTICNRHKITSKGYIYRDTLFKFMFNHIIKIKPILLMPACLATLIV